MIGRYVYGAAAIALGGVGLAFGDFAAVWQPFPDGVPDRQIFAYVVAGLFVLGGLMTIIRRPGQAGPLLLTALFAMFAIGWLLMRLINHPQMYVMYNGVSEQSAMALGGLALFASATEAKTLGFVTQRLFGICLLVFGGAHFVYVTETAQMVPGWLPPDQRLWAQITGAGHAAAGLALISGILDVIAARLLTAMFVGFGLLVWVPTLMAAPHEHVSWAGNAINLALIGAAWCIGDAAAKRRASA